MEKKDMEFNLFCGLYLNKSTGGFKLKLASVSLACLKRWVNLERDERKYCRKSIQQSIEDNTTKYPLLGSIYINLALFHKSGSRKKWVELPCLLSEVKFKQMEQTVERDLQSQGRLPVHWNQSIVQHWYSDNSETDSFKKQCGEMRGPEVIVTGAGHRHLKNSQRSLRVKHMLTFHLLMVIVVRVKMIGFGNKVHGKETSQP